MTYRTHHHALAILLLCLALPLPGPTRAAGLDSGLHWREAAQQARARGEPEAELTALLALAQHYQNLGRHPLASDTLNRAEMLLQQRDNPPARARLLGLRGRGHWLAGEHEAAQRSLTAAVALARRLDERRLLAAALNDLGNIHRRNDQFPQARAAFHDSARLATELGALDLAIRAWQNLARLALLGRDPVATGEALRAADALLESLPPDPRRAFLLIGQGDLARQLGALDRDWWPRAGAALTGAAELAGRLGDARLESHALGLQGTLAEDRGEAAAVAELTERAVFLARQAGAPELLYRWYWQQGRHHRRLGERMAAIQAQREAIRQLESIRQDLLLGRQDSFRDTVGPLFFQQADLLLQEAATRPDAMRQPLLREARDTLERLKAEELTDYFQDRCVLDLQARITPLDRLPAGTAAIYPVLLADRLELLLSLPGEIRQFTVPVTRERLTTTVRAFRQHLEDRTTQRYLDEARRLHDWLVAPLLAALAADAIHTLVFVPDGPLRTVPMATLHDGAQFLVERFAIATTPGIQLTDLRPLDRDGVRLILGGLSEPVQDFPALPFVDEELRAVQEILGGEILLNERFQAPALAEQLRRVPYSVVHMATHGRFSGDLRDTYLLTHDGRLTMDGLEAVMSLGRFREQPVELLTLSACQTAAGDDRAALGLAGVAVKAGARSALATLWFINDETTANLVAYFYQALRGEGVSKARALQRAQLQMLAERRFRHPAYWGAFLLIGNWL